MGRWHCWGLVHVMLGPRGKGPQKPGPQHSAGLPLRATWLQDGAKLRVSVRGSRGVLTSEMSEKWCGIVSFTRPRVLSFTHRASCARGVQS